MTRALAALVPAAVVSLASLASLTIASTASAQDLNAPPPMSTQPPAATYSTTSDESQDSGLGLEWVYLNADAGFAFANMASFSESNLAIQQTSSAGGAFGVGAGVRLLFFTVGARARDLQLSNFNLWELDGEAAFHIRIWRIDPYFGVRGGYAFVGSLSSDAVSTANNNTSDVTVHGFNAGAMFGIDVYLSSLFSIGGEANAELIYLKRPPVALPSGVTQADVAMLPAAQQQLYEQSGSSAGLGIIATLHLGLHF
jgi:hypothetical protein